MDLENFFALMYEERPEGSHMLLWRPTAKGGSSLWTPDLDEAVGYIRKQKGDIYFQVGLAGKRHKRNQRCSLDEDEGRPVVSLPAVFADIDYQHACHKKSDLPPDLDTALALVHGKGFDPTVTIHSGHGIQCYWVFKEPWLTDTAEERREAQKLLTRLKQRLQNDASKMGYSVDSVQDLVRVLRPPESFNCKEEDPIPVEVISANDTRCYNPEDLDELLPPYDPSAGPRTQTPGATTVATIKEMVNNLDFNPDAQPHVNLFAALMDISGAEFSASWNNTKRIKDRSASGYDLSLATLAAQAFWDDQQILDLLFAHRKKHGHDPKLNNKQYYARTLIAARSKAEGYRTEQARKDDHIVEVLTNQKIAQEFKILPDDDTAEVKRKKLSQLFRVEIIRIERYVTQSPIFKIYTAAGDIKLPGLDSHAKVRNKFVNVLKKMPNKAVKKKWDSVAQMMLDICEDVTVAPEATDSGEIIALLREYLEGQGENTLQESTEHWTPFIKKKCWHIYPAKFRDWVTKAVPGIFKNSQELYSRLREAGCKRVDQNVYVGERRTKKTTWKVPWKIAKPDPMNEAELKEQYSGHSVLNTDSPAI